MKKIAIYQVDAFTDKMFGGNPAAVVTNADRLTEADMLHIAREMNLSETAFVLSPTTKKADLRLQYFSPIREIDFCGHATMGTLFQLAKLNKYGLGKKGTNDVQIETGIGILTMSVANTNGKTTVTFLAAPVAMSEYPLQGKQFAKEFGIPANVIDLKGKIFLNKALNDIYIPVISLEKLGELQFASEQTDKKIVVYCFYTKETFDKDSDLHVRCNVPILGIYEDPFTGRIQPGLVHAAKKNKYIVNSQEEITTEQGNFMGRPGFAKVHHDITTDAVSVTASVVQVFSTTITI